MPATVDSAELQNLLTTIDPGARLVPPRIHRRVLREYFQVSGLGLTLPHRRGYPIDRDALLKLADTEELGLTADQASALPPTVLLLEQPSSGSVCSRRAGCPGTTAERTRG